MAGFTGIWGITLVFGFQLIFLIIFLMASLAVIMHGVGMVLASLLFRKPFGLFTFDIFRYFMARDAIFYLIPLFEVYERFTFLIIIICLFMVTFSTGRIVKVGVFLLVFFGMLPMLKYDDNILVLGIGLVFQPDHINILGAGIDSGRNK